MILRLKLFIKTNLYKNKIYVPIPLKTSYGKYYAKKTKIGSRPQQQKLHTQIAFPLINLL